MKMIKLKKLKNNAPFRLYISKCNSILIHNAGDLDVVMLMCNLLKYSQNYSMTSGSLWNYYRDKIYDFNNNALDDKSFKYKTKIVEKRPERPPQPGNLGHANQPPHPAILT